MNMAFGKDTIGERVLATIEGVDYEAVVDRPLTPDNKIKVYIRWAVKPNGQRYGMGISRGVVLDLVKHNVRPWPDAWAQATARDMGLSIYAALLDRKLVSFYDDEAVKRGTAGIDFIEADDPERLFVTLLNGQRFEVRIAECG